MAEEYQHLPEQDYENDITARDFIYFVQDYSGFLRAYINNKYSYDPDEVGYLTSFIDICDGIDTNADDEEYYETYRQTLQPLMEWMTLWAQDMNIFYTNVYQNQQQPAIEEASQKFVADRTRSKQPIAPDFKIPPNEKGIDMISLEPTKQEGVRIKLSDGKSYTYNEIVGMWRFSEVQTPLRHLYTPEDKQKIIDFINFVKEGGRRKTRKMRKTQRAKKVRKPRKTQRAKKVRKTRKMIKTRNKKKCTFAKKIVK
jgi:hypothetical protein